MKIIAKDKEGNEFCYDVKIANGYGGRIMDFGFPIQYRLDGDYGLLKNYPLERDLCIDAGGRNHKGSSVWVTKEDVNKFLKKVLKNERINSV